MDQPKPVPSDKVAAFWAEAQRIIQADQGIKANYQPRLQELIRKLGMTREELAQVQELSRRQPVVIQPIAPPAVAPSTSPAPANTPVPAVTAPRPLDPAATSPTPAPAPTAPVPAESEPAGIKVLDEGDEIRVLDDATLNPLLLLGGSAVVSLLLTGLVVTGFFYFRNQSAGVAIASTPHEGDATYAGPSSKAAEPREKPAWGGDELAQAIDRARQAFPDDAKFIEGIGDQDPARRLQAYRQLLTRPGDAGSPLTVLLAQCWTREPAEANALWFQQEIAARLAGLERLPTDPHAYGLGFASLDLGLLALKHESARSHAIAIALEKALQQRPDPNQPTLVHGELCQQAGRAILQVAAAMPLKALELRGALAAAARQRAPAEMIERFDVDLLVLALPASGADWSKFDPLLRDSVAGRDITNVMRLVDFYEKTTNRPLQVSLGNLLAARVGLKGIKDVPPTELADRVRRGMLGVGGQAALGPLDRRRLLLRAECRQRLDQLGGAPANLEPLLLDTVTLNHLATLASMLTNPDKGLARFDDAQGKPPRLTSPDQVPSLRPAAGRFSGSEQHLDQAVRALVSANAGERANAFRFLAQSGAAMDTSYHGMLAWYVMIAPKVRAELDLVLQHLGPLASQRGFALAVADLTPHSALAPALVERIVAAIVGSDVHIGSDAAWRSRAQKTIYRHLLEQMQPSGALDRARDLLTTQYREQATWLNLDSAELASATSPAQVLEVLCQGLAGRLTKETLPLPSRQWLERTPHDLAVTEYLVRNDLQRTVMLQRIWLRLLAAQAVLRQPARAAAAETICANLDQEDRQATHVLAQLCAGEAAILRMWLLFHEQ